MSMDLSVQKFSTETTAFEAGVFPVAKAVKKAAVDVPARAPVALDESGALVLLTAATVDAVFGVTPDSIRREEEGPVYLTGEFFAESLTMPADVTREKLEPALRKIGIFLK